ncbi:MAG TPA: DNA alkylation repair protein, partial [Candidatus Limnocylindrales bacterium]|nr:DNA alkylation repair protein [Candidatus Limnocylindrales bacterium]
LVGDPPAFAAALRSAFAELAEPEYRIGQRRVAPGIGLTHGVRLPYQAALRRALRKATRQDPPSVLILVADRLLREPELESRWLAMSILERTVLTDPERSWQLLRRAARDADDWITIDTLAHPCGKGILRESYRWAELEQLTISPSRWERRLVGSTIATIPFVDRRAGRAPEVAAQALPLLALLIGDREPDVQKALAWAYRSLTLVDPAATAAALDAEATIAADTADGSRAWVIRDALPKLDPAEAARLRARLDGIRRRPGGPSTSRAAELAERFAGMGLGRPMPEPPL